jgi:tetratricopeptide (TPR) repeat protein
MADRSSPNRQFDVFCSYNREELPFVETLAARLVREAGLRVFLDKWNLVPGEPWQEGLEEALTNCPVCAVFVGAGHIGPWENEEMRAALDQMVHKRHRRVIPVLLPGATKENLDRIPLFLKRLSWVDFTSGLEDPKPFHDLLSGILGKEPGVASPLAQSKTVMKPAIVHPLPPAPYFIGREKELSALESWWQSNAGVLCLTGLGGSGKTALIAEFLNRLIRSADSAGGGLFVWSFYTNDNPDAFLQAITHYFLCASGPGQDDSVPRSPLSRVLSDGQQHLIILDGLERIQRSRSSAAGTFGEIADRSLRDFLRRLAGYGGLGRTHCLVSSRFPLADLSGFRSGGYIELDIEQLGLAGASALLDRRGVKGSADLFRRLYSQYGTHALTLDYLAIYIAEFCAGDLAAVTQLGQPEVASDISEERRLARVLKAYESALTEEETAVLARTCIFRRGATAQTLHAIFGVTSQDERIAGPLSALSLHDFMRVLGRLHGLHLVFQEPGSVYSVHPAVRDYFSRLFSEPYLAHDRVSTHFARLAASPGDAGANERTLDLLEELVFHVLETKASQEALPIYSQRLRTACYQSGRENQERGYRITGMFLEDSCSCIPRQDVALAGHQWADILRDRGLFAVRLGLLDSACNAYSQAAKVDNCNGDTSTDHFDDNYTVCLTETLIKQGRLPRALEVIRSAHIHQTNEYNEEDERRIRNEVKELGIQLRCIEGGVRVLLGEWSFARAVEHVHIYIGNHRSRSVDSDQELCLLDCSVREIPDLSRLGVGSRPMLVDGWLYDVFTARSDIRIADSEESLSRVQEKEERGVAEYDSLCADYLRIGRVFARRGGLSHGQEVERQKLAAVAFESGLRIARRFGLTLYHISLLNALAELNTQMLNYSAAKTCVLSALNGVLKEIGDPPATPDIPSDELEVLGARHPLCGYAWGEAEALHWLGKALLATGEVEEARNVLQTCVSLREKIGDRKLPATQELLGQARST